MSEIQRWSLVVGDDCSADGDDICMMFPVKHDGDWIKFTDHAAALRERDLRIVALEKALRLVAERFMPDGSLCFCRIPDGHKFIHHEEWCVNARAALEAK